MVKVKRITVSLSSGNVIENRFLELDAFSREEIALYAEEFDGYSTDSENIEDILAKTAGKHRSIVQVSDDLIIRHMDSFPQYYIKM